jgi:uncharacterized membrane protein
MIRNPFLLAAVFAGLVAALKAVRPLKPFRAVFDVLPVPFWCYVLPMAGATVGLFPESSPVYDVLSRWALPLCLALLLTGVDLKRLSGLSRPALVMMAAGCAGIMGGAVAAAALFKAWLPPESWKSLGALAASWTGGSANMLAVKEALSAPESVFAPVVVTDSLFAYLWMGFLMTAAAHQDRFDRWTGAPASAHDAPVAAAGRARISFFPALLLAAGLAAASVAAGGRLPVVGSVLTRGSWTVLLVTTLSLGASSVLRREASPGVEKTGTFLLFILLTSLGARATFTAAARSPVFLAAGAVMLAVHAAVLLAAARLTRAPLFLAATASQACVGGTVSAPMVAATYRPALAAAGLLMAVLGNVVGNYLGLLTAAICRGVAR